VSIDKLTFRKVLGRFATGITVVTGLSDEDIAVGLTVNAFTSLSLEPPLVLFCLDKLTASISAFNRNKSFALNMLSEDQQALSVRFSSKIEGRFSGLEFDTWSTGVPILSGCLANLECIIDAVHDGGDHLIIIGRVTRIAQIKEGKPLLYFDGEYGRIA
jgi:flavin reductase (DIM6/NTAB) family NADH-FMN oxidoreductase RutF